MDKICINDRKLYQQAYSILQNMYGSNAFFREGQYEAIESAINNRRTLVVQRTGWGKSLVYFLATKIFRMRGKGLTLVVSPLLALMENQRAAAEKLGLKCECLNSTVGDLRDSIIDDICRDKVDLVLITPETLFSKDVQANLPKMKIGMFVVDEVHCISDWGHDFRLEYFRLKEIIHNFSDSVSVLGTTATASDRVIEDLKEQFGEDVYVSRGHLLRKNLAIQILNMPSKVARYAWLIENIPTLPGTGIIYCLTKKDCETLASFLVENNISAMPYYSGDESKNQYALNKFLKNEIKVLVATVKLGMGFDKGDVSFIVHFQMPGNIVSYYQQIGRAGRQIDKAYIFLMFGQEDKDIHEYFIEKAFPTEWELKKVFETIRLSEKGISKNQIFSHVNIAGNRLEKALQFLLQDGYVYKDASKYFGVGKTFVYRGDYYEGIRNVRYAEMHSMLDLVNIQGCINRHLVNILNDNTEETCGCCEQCAGKIRPEEVSLAAQTLAADFLHRQQVIIEPRKRWAMGFGKAGNSIIRPVNQKGICLSVYGDPGYGELVQKGKYENAGFAEVLVDAGAEVLRPIIQQNNVRYITCIPSLRSQSVQDYAQRLAGKLGLRFLPLLTKIGNCQQKTNENSYYQCNCAWESFEVSNNVDVPDKLILVDDIVDSRWTVTVCGYKLCQRGATWVFPFALADSSQNGSDIND